VRYMEGRMFSETVKYYTDLYQLPADIVSAALNKWNDTEYARNFFKHLKTVLENCPSYNKSFEDMVIDYNNSWS